jgi:hypothetical protein
LGKTAFLSEVRDALIWSVHHIIQWETYWCGSKCSLIKVKSLFCVEQVGHCLHPWLWLTLLMSDSDLLEHILWSSLTRSASSSEPRESLWSKVNGTDRSFSKDLAQSSEGSFQSGNKNPIPNMGINTVPVLF